MIGAKEVELTRKKGEQQEAKTDRKDQMRLTSKRFGLVWVLDLKQITLKMFPSP